jgi:hypothetical protein
MAKELNIYRRFYNFVVNEDESTSYSSFDPYGISASTRNVSQGNATVELNVTVTRVGVGRYYADLTSSSYNTDDIYEVVWYVQYTEEAPEQVLYTQFQYPYATDPTVRIIGRIGLEMENEPSLRVEISRSNITHQIND